jgi:hypothetical protein
MRATWIIASLLVATPGVADPIAPATITIENKGGWPSTTQLPIAVRIDGGAWQRLAPDQTTRPIDVKVGKARAVLIEVKHGKSTIDRWAAIVPGTSYRLTGNPCAYWGLYVDDDAGGHARFRVDTSKVAAREFPLDLTVGYPSDEPLVLDKPGLSAEVEMHLSAMCPRSGGSVTVRSRATKRTLLDATVIGHPGRLHTVTVAGGKLALTVEP